MHCVNLRLAATKLRPKLCPSCRPIRSDPRRWKVTVTRGGEQHGAGVEAQKIRNCGIMAHIDAGKTTTTERFLYYAGVIPTPGEVHHGDTVTDFLPQERERGITIQSAVVTFPWRGHKINLIDTPGHVDFTFEVQRSLRVVDSAVAILDASAGVEAQTLTVWRQASTYELPRLIYLNKMDKSTASLEMSLESIRAKLKVIPVLIQYPFYDGDKAKSSGLRGVVDLVEMKRLLFDRDSQGANITQADVSADPSLKKRRNELVETVADLDSVLAERVIEIESVEGITPSELHSAIRRLTISSKGVPVLLGSSYKNVGVQPLLDSMLRYLPHPEWAKRDPVVSAYGSEMCSFAFKTLHDAQLGPLTFLRIFGGKVHPNQRIYNASREKQEKIAKVYLPLAEELTEVAEANAGEVVLVSGLKDTVTGDTLSLSHSIASSVAKKLAKSRRAEDTSPKGVLRGVNVPEAVYFCSVEPASISQQKALDFALECLQREDPSLHVHVDPDTNQTVLSGMGELHLEIIHQRLKSDYKVDADLGRIQVAYKETIANSTSKRTVFERRLADQKHVVNIELELNPEPSASSKLKLYRGADKEKSENMTALTDKQLKHIQNGIDSAIRYGPKLGFPIIDTSITLHWFECMKGTSDVILEAAAASCFRECVVQAHLQILEPVVDLEVVVDGNYQRILLDDLNKRRFVLQGIDDKHGNKVISGRAPLSELTGYSTVIRTLSSGLGTFSMQLSHYQVVNNPIEEQKIVTKVRGF